MTSSLARRLAAATCGLAAVLTSVAVAAPASAETFSKSDPAGDVASPSGPRPGVEQGDIRPVRFEHGRRAVTLRVGYRELARVGEALQQYIRVDTPSGSYEFGVAAGQGDWRGELVGAPDGCGGTEFKLDYGRDLFTISVPRGCLDSPRWVRVGLVTVTFDGTDENGVRVDDALRRGFGFGGEDIGLSPRLSRAGGSYTG